MGRVFLQAFGAESQGNFGIPSVNRRLEPPLRCYFTKAENRRKSFASLALLPVSGLSSPELRNLRPGWQLFTSWVGNGPFFGALTYFANQRLAEEIDPIPFPQRKGDCPL
jgi:hypothetical protein